jgi:hypothetical protein
MMVRSTTDHSIGQLGKTHSKLMPQPQTNSLDQKPQLSFAKQFCE